MARVVCKVHQRFFGGQQFLHVAKWDKGGLWFALFVGIRKRESLIINGLINNRMGYQQVVSQFVGYLFYDIRFPLSRLASNENRQARLNQRNQRIVQLARCVDGIGMIDLTFLLNFVDHLKAPFIC